MIPKCLRLTGREAWHAWLQANHAVASQAWLTIRRKHATRPGIDYEDAVEEALCFGWIDGVMHRLDQQTFALRFSPRQAGSIWSALNKQRVERLIRAGRMTEAGLKLVRAAMANGEWQAATLREDTTRLPADLERALQTRPRLRQSFESLAPSRKKQLIWWINSAKTEATRQKRITAALRSAANKVKP